MRSSYDTYKPTKKQIIFPMIVLIITLIVGGSLLLGAKRLTEKVEKNRFLAPGIETFHIEEPGNYTIDLTTQIISDTMRYRLPENFEALHIEVTFNEQQVPLTQIEESSIYGKEDHQSRSYLSFEAEKPGAYQVTSYIEGSSIPKLELAIGKTQKNLELVLVLVTCSGMLMLMGICQFIAYMVFNLGRWLYYYYKTQVR